MAFEFQERFSFLNEARSFAGPQTQCPIPTCSNKLRCGRKGFPSASPEAELRHFRFKLLRRATLTWETCANLCTLIPDGNSMYVVRIKDLAPRKGGTRLKPDGSTKRLKPGGQLSLSTEYGVPRVSSRDFDGKTCFCFSCVADVLNKTPHSMQQPNCNAIIQLLRRSRVGRR